jgi:hypothetical protein
MMVTTMEVPPREALLDIDWLTQTYAAPGFKARFED